MRASLLSGTAAGFVLVVATACGGSSATTKPAASPATSQAAASQAAASQAAGGAPTCSAGIAAGMQVGIAQFKFTPDTVAATNGTVTWTNADSATHTVTFDSGPDCGTVATGASVTATFSAPGSYAYHCTIHPNMKGTVTVS